MRKPLIPVSHRKPKPKQQRERGKVASLVACVMPKDTANGLYKTS